MTTLGSESELDAGALQRRRELDPTGANRLLERVFQAFEASAARLLPQMHEAHRAGDHAGVRHVVHTLKSSSASIGAIKLSQLCAEIEAMIRLETLDGLTARIDLMDRETAAVLKALKNVPGPST
jgi:HPt (histidine-containing phosphotransfer) domain-containing protein